MNTASAPAPSNSEPVDPQQRKRVIMGVAVWIGGWILGVSLIPLVNGTDWSTGLKATLNTVFLVGFPKLFLIAAIAIMGKPGFAYLKSLLGGHFRRMAPAATVSPTRYRVGLIMLFGTILLSSIGDYMARDVLSFRGQYQGLLAFVGDILILSSLFVLGGDFWDKLRALFVRDAKVVFPEK